MGHFGNLTNTCADVLEPGRRVLAWFSILKAPGIRFLKRMDVRQYLERSEGTDILQWWMQIYH